MDDEQIAWVTHVEETEGEEGQGTEKESRASGSDDDGSGKTTQLEGPPQKRKRSGRKTSAMWDHFTVVKGSNPERASCNYCKQDYACSTKTHGTKSMWNHLDRCKKYPHNISKQKSIHAFTKKSTTGESEDIASTNNPKLTQKEIRLEIASYFILDELPFKHVNGRGFHAKLYSPRKSLTLKMVQIAENQVVQQQKVIVPNKYGEKLVGILHDTGSVEVIILCHGLGCTKEYKMIINLAVALEKEGISAFRFDFSGNGESEGTFEYGDFKKEVDDLRSIIEHFSSTNRVISGILGHSKGGADVLLYASRYHDIRTVVNVSGRYDQKRGIDTFLGADYMERLKEKGYIDVKAWGGNVVCRVTLESVIERLNTDMHAACLEIDKECRVLTIHGSEDEIVPVEDAYEFAKFIPNHRLHIIEGADHGYNSHQAELDSVAVEFIKEALEQDKVAPN